MFHLHCTARLPTYAVGRRLTPDYDPVSREPHSRPFVVELERLSHSKRARNHVVTGGPKMESGWVCRRHGPDLVSVPRQEDYYRQREDPKGNNGHRASLVLRANSADQKEHCKGSSEARYIRVVKHNQRK